MKYTYNHVGQLVNGLVLIFDEGDREIAISTLEFISSHRSLPMYVELNNMSISPGQALSELHNYEIADNWELGIKFLMTDGTLLGDYLRFLKKEYPNISSLIAEINNQLFGKRH